VRTLVSTLAALALLGGIALTDDPPQDAATFDPARYAGTWYEIASLPQFFTKECVATTSTYTLKDDGDFAVTNACRKGKFDGPRTGISGKMWAPDKKVPAKMKLQLVWPFKADHWVFEVDPEYRYLMEGSPNRKGLWIFSRTSTLDEAVYAHLVERAKTLGFPVEALRRTPQPK
jgi:apolipoprotein D and lipocalin family protein